MLQYQGMLIVLTYSGGFSPCVTAYANIYADTAILVRYEASLNNQFQAAFSFWISLSNGTKLNAKLGLVPTYHF